MIEWKTNLQMQVEKELLTQKPIAIKRIINLKLITIKRIINAEPIAIK